MTQKNNRKYRILAVDDDPAILDLYQQILNAKPHTGRSDSVFEVDCCAQAEEAVEAVKFSLDFNKTYAVVFLDLNMPPGPDGEWAAEQIQKLDPLTNIVLVSGFIRTSPGKLANKSGGPDTLLYLQKPFHRQEILIWRWKTWWDSARRLCCRPTSNCAKKSSTARKQKKRCTQAKLIFAT